MDVLIAILVLAGIVLLVLLFMVAGMIIWLFLPAIVGVVAGVALLISGHDNLGVLTIILGFGLLYPWMVPDGDAWLNRIPSWLFKPFKRR